MQATTTITHRGRPTASLRVVDPEAPVRVMIADAEGLVRAGFRALLESGSGITVVAEVADGHEAVALAREERPDVVLIDLHLPGLDGLEATRRIVSDPAASGVEVVILSGWQRDEDLFGALRAGASGFLVKDTEPDDLIDAVRVVARGEAQLSPGVARRLIEEFAAQPDPQRPVPEELEELTPREREVMALVAMGLSNAEIAEHLVVSPATAKTHVSRTMVKLHAHDRAKLVVLAYESGLLEPRRAGSRAEPVAPAPARRLAAA